MLATTTECMSQEQNSVCTPFSLTMVDLGETGIIIKNDVSYHEHAIELFAVHDTADRWLRPSLFLCEDLTDIMTVGEMT